MHSIIMEYHVEFWVLLGLALLFVEAVLLGFSTGFGLFAGLGAIVTAIALSLGLIPSAWAPSIITFMVATAGLMVALFIPFKRLHTRTEEEEPSASDFAGHAFELTSELSKRRPSTIRYSGIEWRVELDEGDALEIIPAGERVVVSGVTPGVFRVRKHAAIGVESSLEHIPAAHETREHIKRLPHDKAIRLHEQLALIEEHYTRYQYALDARFVPGELTHTRFKALGEELVTSIVANLSEVALHWLSVPDEDNGDRVPTPFGDLWIPLKQRRSVRSGLTGGH